MNWATNTSPPKFKKFVLVAFAAQILIIIFYALFVDYGTESNGSDPANGLDPLHGGKKPSQNSIYVNYYMFQDVHVMIFVGFGFLFTFLRKYGYSAVGVNFFLASIVIQWAVLCEGFFASVDGRIKISLEKLLTADVAAAAALISWGALLGKTSPLQLLIMALFEIPLYATNEWLVLTVLKACDPGASMICHAFAAYFGLAASVMLYRKEHRESVKEASVYHSDLFAMIGTIFLWMFWPSFNAALVSGDDRHRAVINTYLALASCCVMTFIISAWVDEKARFNMVHVQNATLAGGVAMGSACDTMMGPFAALIIGCIAAVICTLGFKYLTPLLARRLRLHDTCGVNDLHGMMGILGGIIGAVMASLASENMYGLGLYLQYPAMAPLENSKELNYVRSALIDIKPGLARTASVQSGYQMIALGTSLGIGIAGGIFTGLVMQLSLFDPPTAKQLYDDTDLWELPVEQQPEEEDDYDDHELSQAGFRRTHGRSVNGASSSAEGSTTRVSRLDNSKV